jgi:hypothetical protein
LTNIEKYARLILKKKIKMPTTEQAPPITNAALEPERLSDPAHTAQHAHAADMLPALAIGDPTHSLRGFHGGGDVRTVRYPGDDTVRWQVARRGEDGSNDYHEIGSGPDVTEAFIDALNQARTLESVKTKPILSLSVDGGKKVHFTELHDYAPRIAPSTEAHEIPPHIQRLMEGQDFRNSDSTYRKTVEEAGWDTRLFGQVADYLATDPSGAALAEKLDITSLNTLTPEQAIKLSLAVVQDLSKYSRDDMDKDNGSSRADNMTTMELLQEGRERRADPEWSGNGVCRNVASNVKAVFEALKANQSNLSMLRNTYAVYGGSNGEGYDNKREDILSNTAQQKGGHAWNTFVTVGGEGSATMTIVDATWALERDADTALEHMDYTLPRMATIARGLFEKSDDKAQGFGAMGYYYDRLLMHGRHNLGAKKREQLEQFIATEFIGAASSMTRQELEAAAPTSQTMSHVIEQTAGRLDSSEARALYRLSEAKKLDNFGAILDAYVAADSPLSKGMRLVEHDDGFQQAIFSSLGPQEVQKLGQIDRQFQDRVRELAPHLLST